MKTEQEIEMQAGIYALTYSLSTWLSLICLKDCQRWRSLSFYFNRSQVPKPCNLDYAKLATGYNIHPQAAYTGQITTNNELEKIMWKKYCQAEQEKLRQQSQAKENKLSVYSLHITRPLFPPSNVSLFKKRQHRPT